MGVIGTFCQLCALPTQHDHYVRTPGDQMMEIYRGGQNVGVDRHFRFGAEHEWLTDAVGIRAEGAPSRGAASDGMIGDLFVAEGAEDGVALHAFCYTLMGEPKSRTEVVRTQGTHRWALVEPYQQQLFEFHFLREQGLAWMLADPRNDSRSRQRIEALLAAARSRLARPPAVSVAQVLANDGSWCAEITKGDPLAIRRFRNDVRPGIDVTGYPTLIWLMKEYGASGRSAALTGAFHDFEIALKDAIERDGNAVLVMTTYSERQSQFVIYARDEAKTRAVIDALPGAASPIPHEYDNQPDPEWRSYFENDWPGR